jgi:LmbE family N-acetylglucosaminyl deacetylase
MNYHNFTLMAVLAHPDDETFGIGGTLAYYARLGVKVYLLTATRGEAGEMDPEYLEGFNSIAERRMHELDCAANHLGIQRVIYLGYRDSGMTGAEANQHPQALIQAPLEEVAGKVAHHIRELHPQVVITFDPIGGYKHPDHIAIHRATVRAWEIAGDPAFQDGLSPFRPGKLYYYNNPKRLMKIVLFLLRLTGRNPRRFGKNQDIDLQEIVEEGNFPVHTRIHFGKVQEVYMQAVACHASQGGLSFNRGPLGVLRRLFGQNDYYMRAFPPVENGKLETDLFAGLE